MVAQEDSTHMGHQDEFLPSNSAVSSYNGKRRKRSSNHRYKTLRAKVKDVIGASDELDSSPQQREGLEQLDVVFEDDSQYSLEQENLSFENKSAYVNDEHQEQEDLTDPTEWRKFIDSVKKEVAEGPYSLPTDQTNPRVDETRQDVRDAFRSSRSRAPISLRRLFPFGKGEKRYDDDVDSQRQTPQRSRSPDRRSRSPIKRSLSPTKFRRRSDPSDLIESISNSSGNIKVRGGSFRFPRFSSPSRRSPYAQLSTGTTTRESRKESVNKTPCTIIPDVSQEVVNSEIPSTLNNAMDQISHAPQQSTTSETKDDCSEQQNAQIFRRKPTRLAPKEKPIPPEIQELNNQVKEAVGSGIHEDDDTSGSLIQNNEGSVTETASDNALLDNINISTTSGVQVKRDGESEEMIHQTIARRVLSVLIRPSPKGSETRTAENGNTTHDRAISPSEDEYTDVPDVDTPLSGSIGAGDTTTSATTHSKTSEKIREQLKLLKAKKAHISLKKKAEKSRKKHEKTKKQKKRKSKNASVTSRHSEQVDRNTSYESFDSFSTKAGANCLTSSCCCCFDSKSSDVETETETAGFSSDASLDTYESEWAGRPLPILSPSDLSAENDDVFDLLEKCVCGAN